jgi:hypothetical protein
MDIKSVSERYSVLLIPLACRYAAGSWNMRTSIEARGRPGRRGRTGRTDEPPVFFILIYHDSFPLLRSFLKLRAVIHKDLVIGS